MQLHKLCNLSEIRIASYCEHVVIDLQNPQLFLSWERFFMQAHRRAVHVRARHIMRLAVWLMSRSSGNILKRICRVKKNQYLLIPVRFDHFPPMMNCPKCMSSPLKAWSTSEQKRKCTDDRSECSGINPESKESWSDFQEVHKQGRLPYISAQERIQICERGVSDRKYLDLLAKKKNWTLSARESTFSRQ